MNILPYSPDNGVRDAESGNLQEMIAGNATLPWIAQISVNLLKDEELLDLMAASGARCIFIGLESVDVENLSGVHKSFNKPADYDQALHSLAHRDFYAITSLIFGMDGDTPGVASRTAEVMEAWPPVLPVFSLREAWTRAYSPRATMEALRKVPDRPLSERAVVFFARMAFRGIYFPQVRPRHWLSLLWNNRRVLLSLCYEVLQTSRLSPPGSADPRREIA